MSGILSGSCFQEHKLAFSFLIFFILILLFLSIYSNKKFVFFLSCCLIFCFGILSIQSRLFPDLPSDHIVNYPDRSKITITGKIVSFAKHYKRKSRITLLCQSIKTKDNIQKKVTGRINVNIYGQSNDMPVYGDIIMFESSVKSIRNFMNPGSFDYERFLKLKGVYGTAYTTTKKLKILTNKYRDQSGLPAAKTENSFAILRNFFAKNNIGFFTLLLQKIERLRTNYYYFVLNHAKDPTAGKILTALVTGKKEVISSDVRDLFSKAGISHLLAISGLHLSIVGFLFFFLFYRLLSFVPSFLISGRSKKAAGILTILPLLFYTVFSGFSPSTQRAALMIIVVLVSYIFEKEKDIFATLSIAGILILVLDPGALFSISFQLSFAAVIFIVCGIALLKRYPFGLKKNKFSKTIQMVCAAFFAGMGTFPLSAHYFNIISYVQVISNIIAIPVTGFIVLPLGLISLVCFPLLPQFAAFIVNICSHLILFLISFSSFFESMPFAWSRIVTLQWIEIIAVYLIFIVVLLILKTAKKIYCIFFNYCFCGDFIYFC